MSLSLNAEQRSILEIFKIDKQYIIPAFQRPYSWDFDQCLQLYTDLLDAYERREDYFVGNIILAVSDSDKKKLEVIDGQQRLTTFFLILKVIAVLEENETIKSFIQATNWKGQKVTRLESKVIETNDPANLNQVLEYSKEIFEERLEECRGSKGVINSRKCEHKFEQNALCFYQWLKDFRIKKGEFENFIDYLFERVSLLPIQLTGKTKDDARRKALTIFETVNNRGMSLEDADIFKAKLYEDAERVNASTEFISEWKEFRNKCDDLGLEIDDIFRYYSHIIRGKEGITSNETNMRDFFTNNDYSPFKNKRYDDILADLLEIINIIEYIDNEKRKTTELAKWLQLIDYYSNQYPKLALVVYLFTNGIKGNEGVSETITFCQSLIRYVYAKGATTTIKYEIYNIIKQVCQEGTVKTYERSFTRESIYPLGRLKYGYALLAFYLKSEQALVNYHTGRIINTKDTGYFQENVEGWQDIDITEKIDYLANIMVTDVPQRNIIYVNKVLDLAVSKIDEVKELFTGDYTYDKFIRREETMADTLIDFFNNKK